MCDCLFEKSTIRLLQFVSCFYLSRFILAIQKREFLNSNGEFTITRYLLSASEFSELDNILFMRADAIITLSSFLVHSRNIAVC